MTPSLYFRSGAIAVSLLALSACGQSGNGAADSTAEAPAAAAATTGNDGAGLPAEARTLIMTYLDNYAGNLAAGFSRPSGTTDEIVGLQAGGEHDWRVQLTGGTSYRVIGACDNECDDVDLILLDAAGTQVSSDVLTDDYPVVNVTPQADGVYTIRTRLVTCTIEPCYVGARLLQQ